MTATAHSDWLHIFISGEKINTGKLSELDSITFLRSKAQLLNSLHNQSSPHFPSEGIGDIAEFSNLQDPGFDTVIPHDSIAAYSIPTPFDTLRISRNSNPTNIPLSDIDSIIIGSNIATMRINVKNGANITSKTTYRSATIAVEGNGYCPDFEATDASIRQRGNTSWSYPQKTYRLKFSKKTSHLRT